MSLRYERRVTQKTRFEVLKRDRFTCLYCGAEAPDVEVVVDHLVPLAAGGSNEMSNLITACVACNGGKSDIPLHVPASRYRRKRPSQWWHAIKIKHFDGTYEKKSLLLMSSDEISLVILQMNTEIHEISKRQQWLIELQKLTDLHSEAKTLSEAIDLAEAPDSPEAA